MQLHKSYHVNAFICLANEYIIIIIIPLLFLPCQINSPVHPWLPLDSAHFTNVGRNQYRRFSSVARSGISIVCASEAWRSASVIIVRANVKAHWTVSASSCRPYSSGSQIMDSHPRNGSRRSISSAVLTYVATVAWPQGPALLSTTFSKSPVRLLECPPCPPRWKHNMFVIMLHCIFRNRKRERFCQILPLECAPRVWKGPRDWLIRHWRFPAYLPLRPTTCGLLRWKCVSSIDGCYVRPCWRSVLSGVRLLRRPQCHTRGPNSRTSQTSASNVLICRISSSLQIWIRFGPTKRKLSSDWMDSLEVLICVRPTWKNLYCYFLITLPCSNVFSNCRPLCSQVCYWQYNWQI